MNLKVPVILLLGLLGFAVAQDAPAPVTAIDATTTTEAPARSIISLGPQKVNITVLYEAYCKDSSWFITKQLVPVYKALKDQVIVDLVPFGRAKIKEPKGSETSVSFTCRHGPSECISNIVHSCAIALYPDTELHLSFIACTLKTWKPERSVKKCTRNLKMDSEKILGCSTSPQGKILLQRMGLRTLSVKPTVNYIPSIIIDGNFNKRNQRKMQKDLMTTVCKHFKPPVPAVCEKRKKAWFKKK